MASRGVKAAPRGKPSGLPFHSSFTDIALEAGIRRPVVCGHPRRADYVIEAMSCGVPVVATTGGALPEVVGTSGETGMLVEPNNPDALVKAIRLLLDDRELADRLGANGRERVIERFTWQVTARGTAACYDAILSGEPLPASVDFD